MRIFHIATASDWVAAKQTGHYATSTRGRSLPEEGFIHASRAEQVEGVRASFFADIDEPLVLLTIDTDLLTSKWQEVPVADDTFPHIYGPLDVDAVVEVAPL